MLLSSQRSRRAAFTIIELLVAATITLVLVGLMLQITVQTLGIWNQTSGRLSAGNQAKVVLDYLEEDFQGMVMKNDGDAWLMATIEDPNGATFLGAAMEDAKWNVSGVTDGRVKPAAGTNAGTSATDSLDFQTGVPNQGRRDLVDYRFGQAGVWLRMFTHERDSADSSLRAVGYQLVRSTPVDLIPNNPDTAGSERSYQLFRSSVGAQNTFNAGYDLRSAANPGYNTPSGTDRNAGNISRPNRNYLIANNVVDFGVRLWSRDASGNLTLLFPQNATNRGFSGPSGTAVAPVSPSGLLLAAMSAGRPAVADVFIRILTDEGARLVANFEYGRTAREAGYATDDEYWWALVERNSLVFTRRVTIAVSANL
jgi:hypothetical protein